MATIKHNDKTYDWQFIGETLEKGENYVFPIYDYEDNLLGFEFITDYRKGAIPDGRIEADSEEGQRIKEIYLTLPAYERNNMWFVRDARDRQSQWLEQK